MNNDETSEHPRRAIDEGLAYIANSPAPEFCGFNPQTVQIAKDALAELERLRAIIIGQEAQLQALTKTDCGFGGYIECLMNERDSLFVENAKLREVANAPSLPA